MSTCEPWDDIAKAETATLYMLWSPSTHTYPIPGRQWEQDNTWRAEEGFQLLQPTMFAPYPKGPGQAGPTSGIKDADGPASAELLPQDLRDLAGLLRQAGLAGWAERAEWAGSNLDLPYSALHAEHCPRCGMGGRLVDARYPQRGFTKLCQPCLDAAVLVLGPSLGAIEAAAETLLADMKDVTSDDVQARWRVALEAAGEAGRQRPDRPYVVVRAALEALAGEGQGGEHPQPISLSPAFAAEIHRTLGVTGIPAEDE